MQKRWKKDRKDPLLKKQAQLQTAKRWALVQYWGGGTVEFLGFFIFSHCSASSCQESGCRSFFSSSCPHSCSCFPS